MNSIIYSTKNYKFKYRKYRNFLMDQMIQNHNVSTQEEDYYKFEVVLVYIASGQPELHSKTLSYITSNRK